MKTRNFTKVLSAVMALVVVLSTLVILPLTVSADGTDPVTLTGEGTEASPYLVGTAAELAAMKTASEAIAEAGSIYVTLTADIEVAADFQLNASIYASDANAKIAWNFDGDGHTISGLTQPLFGGLNAQGGGHTFKNLTLEGDVVDTERYTGILVGMLYGSATFENVTTKGSLTTSKTGDNVHAGGIVGVAEKGGEAINFINCTNYADITLPATANGARAAGIIASLKHYGVAGNYVHTLQNCVNYGDIVSNNGYAGGLVAQVNPNANLADLNYTFSVVNAINEGAIGLAVDNEGTDNDIAAAAKAGAIVAEFTQQGAPAEGATQAYGIAYSYDMSETAGLAVYNKIDDVTVTAEGPTAAFTIASFDDLKLLKTASVSTVDGSTDKLFPEGARIAVKFTADIEVTDASFRMNDSVYASDHNAKLMWYIDGQGNTITGLGRPLFRGLSGKGSVIKNLHLNSAITTDAERYLGGLVTIAYGPITIEGVTVSGTVSTAYAGTGAQVVGGIIGYAAQYNGIVVRNCTNYATVVAHEAADGNINIHVGGIIGKLGHYGSAQTVIHHLVENCVNEGAVVGAYNAGGIIGQLNPEGDTGHFADYTATIKNCVNKGTVQASYADASKGAIVGFVQGTTTGGETVKNINIVDSYNTNTDLTLVGGTDALTNITPTNCFEAAEAADAANAEAIAAINANLHVHNYEADCTIECLDCGYDLRTDAVDHTYETCESTACTECGTTREAGACEWENACDAECDVCGATRTPDAHQYEHACDSLCKVCGAGERTPAANHTYDNACDADCNVCGAERTPDAHAYDNDCDATCNACGAERTPSAHVYDDDKDATCNVCGAERTVAGEDTPATTTTAAPETTTAAEEDDGCGSALNSTYAIIALVAVLGFAFVAKKREEN